MSIESPPLPDLQPESTHTTRSTVLLLIGMLAGVLAIALATLWENRQIANEPWKDALVVYKADPIWENTIPIRARKINPAPESWSNELAAELSDTEGGEEVVQLLGLGMRESIVAIDTPVETLAPLLASGRLPEPGAHEVLAGAVCRYDHFEVGDQSFEVVGRLKGGTVGFLFAYVMPKHVNFDHLFIEQEDVRVGWVAPAGQREHPEWADELKPLVEESEAEILTPLIYVPRGPAFLAIIGLVVVLISAIPLQIQLMTFLARRFQPFQWFTNLFVAERGFFWATHGVTYAMLFLPMIVALSFPHVHLQVLTYVTRVFTEGELQSLGDAYFSKNIGLATWETWRNNYLMQTLLLVLLPGILPGPGTLFGAGKMLLSLGFAGFALCPNWAGIMSGYTYHSITVALEVEAYTLAVFVIIALAAKIIRALFQRQPMLALEGIRGWAAGIVVIGLWLGVAALYESVTLIMLRQ